jgi:structural maintenance of chromosome 4
MIRQMVLENFKSYAGTQYVGPFHKVRDAARCLRCNPGTLCHLRPPALRGAAPTTELDTPLCDTPLRVMVPLCVQNFSAVVGPNGSGKSNVIDAMLFVFGRRAKQVRTRVYMLLVVTQPMQSAHARL